MKILAINNVAIKVITYFLVISPIIWLYFAVTMDKLSADPAKDIQHFLGIGTLRILLLIVLIPIIVRITQFKQLFSIRKILGIWCFIWATLHLFSYLLFEIGIENISLFFAEITQRVYLILGLIAWLLLLLLAATSFNYIKIKLGVYWAKIHSTVYIIMSLALVHYVLSLKTLTPEAIIYSLIAIGIILYRYKIKSS
nr:ferric reductase-like transmembrane domain-containing protein [uncultured Moellerella sp.]